MELDYLEEDAYLNVSSSTSTTTLIEEDHPLGYPSILIWELDENSTRWDKLRAAPSDHQLRQMWMAWSIAFTIFSAFNLVVFLAILLKKQTRRNAFNQYLLALMIPDIIMINFCAWQCAQLSRMGGYQSNRGCLFQSWYIFGGAISDMYVNAVIAWEVKALLMASQKRQRYFPPSKKRIVVLSSWCYLWAFFVASWPFFGTPLLQTDSMRGLLCVPLEHNVPSSIFFWTAYFICGGFLPLSYISYVAFVVYRQNLLPPKGKKREIAIFFFRIYFVFCVCWVPTLMGAFAAGSLSLWIPYFFLFWSHATGLISALVSCLKKDIWQATKDLVTCNTWKANRQWEIDQRSDTSPRRLKRGQTSNSFSNSSKAQGLPSFFATWCQSSWFSKPQNMAASIKSVQEEDEENRRKAAVRHKRSVSFAKGIMLGPDSKISLGPNAPFAEGIADPTNNGNGVNYYNLPGHHPSESCIRNSHGASIIEVAGLSPEDDGQQCISESADEEEEDFAN